MKKIFALFGIILLCGFSSQPLDERKMQDDLPMSKSETWQILGKTKIIVDAKQGYYSAKIPSSVKDLSGKEITISGFMMPLESKPKFKHFLLAKRTPTCAFCPPGEPNEIIDVWTKKEIAFNEDMINVKGTFELMNDREMGLFFKLKDAAIVK
ncbi:MAG: DUF3299 domain-containing protein [Pseudomonadota bacterium]